MNRQTYQQTENEWKQQTNQDDWTKWIIWGVKKFRKTE